MEFQIPMMVALIIMLMGVLSIMLVHMAKRDLHEGALKKLLTWMLITIFVSGVPYSIWIFLVESKMITLNDPAVGQMVGAIFVLLFFGFILRTAVVAKELGQAVSFKNETDVIAKEIKKARKSKK
jgi:hypothetical protein